MADSKFLIEPLDDTTSLGVLLDVIDLCKGEFVYERVVIDLLVDGGALNSKGCCSGVRDVEIGDFCCEIILRRLDSSVFDGCSVGFESCGGLSKFVKVVTDRLNGNNGDLRSIYIMKQAVFIGLHRGICIILS